MIKTTRMIMSNTHLMPSYPVPSCDSIWHRRRCFVGHSTFANGLRFTWNRLRLTYLFALMSYILLATMKLTEAGSYFRLTQRNNHGNISELLDNLLRGYDNSVRPDFGGPPATVEVDIMVRSMGPISEVDMTYSMDCYFRQSWVDKRLAFKGAQTTLALSVSMLKRIWKPDTYFYNGKQSYLHTITTPNKFVRIHQNGKVLYSSRLTIKAGCPMNLEDFPMDIQKCPLKFGSFGYTTADVIYRWNKERPAVAIAEDMKLSQFDLVDCPAGNLTDVVYEAAAPHYYHPLDDSVSSSQQFNQHQPSDWQQHQNHSDNKNSKLIATFSGPVPKSHHVRGTGIKLDKGGFGSDTNGGSISIASDQRSEYSMLMVNFHLKRHMGNFLIQVYGPCCLLVVLSWVSFWLNREATADRVSLGITTVLTMTFLGLEARTDLPKVPYPTALDFFVFLSFAFIFATIVQFAVVHYFTKYGSGECYFIIEEIDSDTETESAVRQTPKLGGISADIMTPSSSADSKIYEVIPLTTCSINIRKSRDRDETHSKLHLRGSYKKRSRLAVIVNKIWNWCSLTGRRPKPGMEFEISDDDNEEQHLRANEDITTKRYSGRRMSYYRREELDARRKGKRTPQYNSVSKIDRASRFVFPMLFLLINVFYWYGYLSRSSRFLDHSNASTRCFLLAI